MDASNQSWEEIAVLEIDSATCAFADAEALGPDFEASPEMGPAGDGPVQDWNTNGLPLIACNTREDMPLPVEVALGADGRVKAARLTFTTDVDELESAGEGQWQRAGQLHIDSGKCLAADPFCRPLSAYRVRFDVVPGPYSAETFKLGHDCLGLRISLAAEPGPRQ